MPQPTVSRGITDWGVGSVCPAVKIRYVFQTGRNTPKIISRPNNLRYLLTLTPTTTIWCNRNTPKIGWNRSGVRSTKKLQYLRNGARQDQGYYDGLIRKSHMLFRLAPKSMTLDDRERLKGSLAKKNRLTEPTFWKSRKLIIRTISPTPSLFVAQRPCTYSQGNMEKSERE